MDSTAEQKRKIRAVMTNKRDHLGSAWKLNYDQVISDQLIQLVDEQNYQIVHTYLPFRSEIDISPFIQYLLKTNRTVVVPQTLSAGQLKHHVLRNFDEIVTGQYGTSYSNSNEEYQGPYDLVLVPGLAFDPKNYRLGYGGGYYDRFLATIPEVNSIGLAYPFQVINKFPLDSYDQRLKDVLLVAEYQG